MKSKNFTLNGNYLLQPDKQCVNLCSLQQHIFIQPLYQNASSGFKDTTIELGANHI